MAAAATVTVAESIAFATLRARKRQAASADQRAKREYALAITALEDAQMRYTRGRAMDLDCYAPADLDKND